MPEYYIYSSVTGQKLVELDETGAMKKINVHMGSTVIAEYTSGFGTLFKHTDPITGSQMQTEASGEITPYDVGRVELEALGAVLPTQPPEIQEPPHNFGKGGSTSNPESGCQLNSAPVSCRRMMDTLRAWGVLFAGDHVIVATFKDTSRKRALIQGTRETPGYRVLRQWTEVSSEILRTEVISLPSDTPEEQIEQAFSRAEELVKGKKCADAIAKLLQDARIAKSKELLQAAGASLDYLEDPSFKDLLKTYTGNTAVEAAKSLFNQPDRVISPKDLRVGGGSHDSAAVETVNGKRHIEFYAGFFNVIMSGKSDITILSGPSLPPSPYRGDKTSLDDRARSIIHEGFHALDYDFSDAFLGQIITGSKKSLSKAEGSKAITDFVKENCK